MAGCISTGICSKACQSAFKGAKVFFRKLRIMKKKLLIGASVALLVAAWIYSYFSAGRDVAGYLWVMLPQANRFEKVSSEPLVFKALDASGESLGCVAFGQANGYGGPLILAVLVDNDGKVSRVEVVENKETPVYLARILRSRFMEQFKNKPLSASFRVGEDLDAISGATVSSRAIADAVRVAAHSAGRRYFNLDIREKQESWHFGVKEASAALLFVLAAAAALFWKNPKARFPLLCVSVAVLGFWLNSPLSLSFLSGALLGYFPPIRQNTLWYIVVVGGVGLALFSGRNIYCYWLCPFGGVQEIVNRASGLRLGAGGLDRKLRLTRNILLWAGLMLVFIFRNPALGSFEPFSTLFGMKGTGAAWLQLFLILVAAIFVLRFWCGRFCPVGAALDICAGVASSARDLLKKTAGKGVNAKTSEGEAGS